MSNFAEGILYKESVSQAWDTIKGQINTNEVTKVISGAGNSRQTESIMSPETQGLQLCSGSCKFREFRRQEITQWTQQAPEVEGVGL